jgi:hypothetical protein
LEAASAAEVATGTPRVSPMRSAFEASRFHRTTSKPARLMVAAIAPPIRPVPITATVDTPSSTVQRHYTGRRELASQARVPGHVLISLPAHRDAASSKVAVLSERGADRT